MGSMKVHQLSRGLVTWDHESHQQPSLSLSCKRLRPLAPKLATSPSSSSSVTFDLKSFIRPEKAGRRKPENPNDLSGDLPQVETQPGGTRWNPTQEQIGILEMLYKGGMRTPNAQQIEQITVQLGKFGKIEGKNVFYWFQNHKARERQKQKRNSLGLVGQTSPRTVVSPTPPAMASLSLTSIRGDVGEKEEEGSCNKRKSRSWAFEFERLEVENRTCRFIDNNNVTLELFPLHPEGR